MTSKKLLTITGMIAIISGATLCCLDKAGWGWFVFVGFCTLIMAADTYEVIRYKESETEDDA